MSTSRPVKRQYGSDLIRIAKVILHRWWMIVLAAAVLALLAYTAASVMYKPQYISSMTLIVNNRNAAASETENYVTYTDVQASKQLAKTCSYVLQSDQVVEGVSKILEEPVTSDTIGKMTTLSVLEDTNMIQIEVKAPDAQKSYQYAMALEAMTPLAIRSLTKADSVELVNGAVMPTQAAPNETAYKFLLLGLIGGAVLSLGWIIIRDISRNTVKSRADAADLGTPVLGTIPRVSLKRYYGKSGKKRALLITDRLAEFSFVENYKAIRTKLEALALKEHHQTLLVTSTLENEGKTTVSINLAIALAQNGKSVLLIDADLRKPALHQALSISDHLDVGLIQVLSGKMPWQKPVRRMEELGIDLMISGGVSDHSAELLDSDKMKEMLAEMCKFYDYILVDTPPVHIVTDAAVLTAFVDASLLVVREDSARIPDICQAMEQLEQREAKLAGCVFNSAMEEESTGYRRGYYKGGYYGRGKGYGGYGYGGNYRYGAADQKTDR